jgi:hypothetical protein
VRKNAVQVFDEHVIGGKRVYTADHHSEALGRHDQIAVQVTVNDVETAGHVTVTLQHSGDGVHFLDKSKLVDNKAIAAHKTTALAGVDSGEKPNLRLVRLAIEVQGSARAHVRIHATMRDQA